MRRYSASSAAFKLAVASSAVYGGGEGRGAPFRDGEKGRSSGKTCQTNNSISNKSSNIWEMPTSKEKEVIRSNRRQSSKRTDREAGHVAKEVD